MTTTRTEQPLPSLLEQVNNARLAAQRVVSRVLEGDAVLATKEEADTRLGVCRVCEFYRASDGRCSECGCFIRAKARLLSENCPRNRWNTETAMEDKGAARVLDGVLIIDSELSVREAIPVNCELAQLLNQYHRDLQQGGCSSCKRRRYARAIAAAAVDFLNTASPADRQSFRNVFPNTTHIAAGHKAVPWSRFGL